MSEAVAGMFAATGKPYRSATSHPAMIRHRMQSRLWKMNRKPGFLAPHSSSEKTGMRNQSAADRMTAGFMYVGPKNLIGARSLGVLEG